jgi:hypothetical protein
MRDKSVKYRKVSDETAKQIKRWASDDACKYQFMLWAASAQLDVAGIHEGYPIFRPAIVAWEAWQTAWNLSNRKKRKPPNA